MAKNLQSKLPPSDTIKLFDINSDAINRLAGEMRSSQTGGAAVETSSNVHDAAKEAVCSHHFYTSDLSHDDYCSIYDLSWGRFAGLPMIIHLHYSQSSEDIIHNPISNMNMMLELKANQCSIGYSNHGITRTVSCKRCIRRNIITGPTQEGEGVYRLLNHRPFVI